MVHVPGAITVTVDNDTTSYELPDPNAELVVFDIVHTDGVSDANVTCRFEGVVARAEKVVPKAAK